MINIPGTIDVEDHIDQSNKPVKARFISPDGSTHLPYGLRAEGGGAWRIAADRMHVDRLLAQLLGESVMRVI
jgi:hypothetical protein